MPFSAVEDPLARLAHLAAGVGHPAAVRCCTLEDDLDPVATQNKKSKRWRLANWALRTVGGWRADDFGGLLVPAGPGMQVQASLSN